MKPMKLAAVRQHTGRHMTVDEAATFVSPRQPRQLPFNVTKDYRTGYRQLIAGGERVDFDPALPYVVAAFLEEGAAQEYVKIQNRHNAFTVFTVERSQ